MDVMWVSPWVHLFRQFLEVLLVLGDPEGQHLLSHQGNHVHPEKTQQSHGTLILIYTEIYLGVLLVKDRNSLLVQWDRQHHPLQEHPMQRKNGIVIIVIVTNNISTAQMEHMNNIFSNPHLVTRFTSLSGGSSRSRQTLHNNRVNLRKP